MQTVESLVMSIISSQFLYCSLQRTLLIYAQYLILLFLIFLLIFSHKIGFPLAELQAFVTFSHPIEEDKILH